jgi:hypothetical protein
MYLMKPGLEMRLLAEENAEIFAEWFVKDVKGQWIRRENAVDVTGKGNYVNKNEVIRLEGKEAADFIWAVNLFNSLSSYVSILTSIGITNHQIGFGFKNNVAFNLTIANGSAYLTWQTVIVGKPSGGRSWYDNAGVYITGAFLTAEDIYNNYFHNHSTYITTKGVVKNIYKANGAVRSLRAAKFARNSMTLKILGTIGTALMAAQAGTKIYNGSATALDYGDFTVGSVGTVAGAAELIGGVSYAVPGLAEAVAAYAWFRLWYDLGAQYGPSKWYGNDDTRWFK